MASSSKSCLRQKTEFDSFDNEAYISFFNNAADTILVAHNQAKLLTRGDLVTWAGMYLNQIVSCPKGPWGLPGTKHDKTVKVATSPPTVHLIAQADLHHERTLGQAGRLRLPAKHKPKRGVGNTFDYFDFVHLRLLYYNSSGKSTTTEKSDNGVVIHFPQQDSPFKWTLALLVLFDQVRDTIATNLPSQPHGAVFCSDSDPAVLALLHLGFRLYLVNGNVQVLRAAVRGLAKDVEFLIEHVSPFKPLSRNDLGKMVMSTWNDICLVDSSADLLRSVLSSAFVDALSLDALPDNVSVPPDFAASCQTIIKFAMDNLGELQDRLAEYRQFLDACYTAAHDPDVKAKCEDASCEDVRVAPVCWYCLKNQLLRFASFIEPDIKLWQRQIGKALELYVVLRVEVQEAQEAEEQGFGDLSDIFNVWGM